MAMSRIILTVFCLLLMGCHSTASRPLQSEQAAKSDWKLPYGDWGFAFFSPYALRASAVYVQVLDTDGYLYRFGTQDSTQDDPDSIGTWSLYVGRSVPFAKVKKPPQYMLVCWDSVIDKKSYETRILFSADTWARMKTPADHTNYAGHTVWYDTLLIGLAPEGKVRLWLQDVGDHPNIPVIPHTLITHTGKEMKFCQGITDHSDGYVYYGKTPEYIKNKTYPYGDW